jgi:hypothetical protein
MMQECVRFVAGSTRRQEHSENTKERRMGKYLDVGLLMRMSKLSICRVRLTPLSGVDVMKNGKNGQTGSAQRKERLQIMLDAEELRAVDTFRFAHRMPSRAAAVRELIRLGLAATGTKSGTVATEGAKSSDYGVLSQPKVRE